MQPRCILEHNPAAQPRLVIAMPKIKRINHLRSPVLRTNHPDEHHRMTQVRTHLDVVDRHQHIRKGMIPRDHGPKLTLQQFAHSDNSVLHDMQASLFSRKTGEPQMVPDSAPPQSDCAIFSSS